MTNVAQQELTGAQIMTLAAIAATAATPRPSGETLEAQAQRMLRGIGQHLADPSLDTGGVWQVVWLGLSPDNADMAYIAATVDGSNRFVLAVRGTVDNPTDMMEDLDVGTVVPFTASGSPTPVAVSAGAMAAFTQVANASGVVASGVVPPGATLTGAFAALLAAAPVSPRPTIHVTGHSLGGCVATMLAAYLEAQTWTPGDPQVALVTFAAPTAGLADFAAYVDSRPWSLYATYANTYDLVPRAWWDMDAPLRDKWYPKPGPKADGKVKFLLKQIAKLSNGHVYVQPNAAGVQNLNPHYEKHDAQHISRTTADFLAQIAYQHADDTYLALLGANPVPAGPVVTGLSRTEGNGGMPIVIQGSGFTHDSVVDFGPVPCPEIIVDPSGETITASTPVGLGVVDVRVTNDLGTSPAAPLARFAYEGPAPLVVSAVARDRGTGGDQVTISGSGFVQGATVRFGEVAAEQPAVQSATEIAVTVPPRPSSSPDHDTVDDTPDPESDGLHPPKTVNVTVTVDEFTSPTSAADEFTYTL